VTSGDVGRGRFEVRWQIIQKLLPEFMAECNGERIIKIGPYLPKTKSQKDCVGVLF